VRLWEAETGRPLARLNGHLEGVTSVTFSPDGKTLASGSYDNTIRLWNLATRQQVAILRSQVYNVLGPYFAVHENRPEIGWGNG
jgi:WD40 repeat protein